MPKKTQLLLLSLLMVFSFIAYTLVNPFGGLTPGDILPQLSTPVTAITPAAPSGAATPSTAPIVIQVSGFVFKPGYYSVPAVTTVADAIRIAGGLSIGADSTQLNMSDRLTDGTKVYVPGYLGPKPAAVPADGAAATGNPASATPPPAPKGQS